MAAAAQNDQHYAIKVAVDRNEGQFTTGEWEVGLCGCCTDCVPNCLMTSFCPCVSMAQISARLGMMEYCCALLVYLVLLPATGGCATAVWLCMARKETRERFEIPGGCCGDYLASFCWGCCAMAQPQELQAWKLRLRPARHTPGLRARLTRQQETEKTFINRKVAAFT
ncbi:hypothetical protein PHYSODRAFT_253676 [Phytophthora sojae]|uniref:PLAC8 family protein n=1 Tax=Phytophthora sojae (strain P6497) TaxID=1094619 RepID=G5AAE6_PHYSP|nr:hypothetical protein PHYSODRAFT_253676 [Phytophthora sojae]EGZ07575.1 hypothetical protein PHYSODRAFT_253676 [Phytophthora sojae]|eukprot:XP_009537141.1 hypothetical protein PHYSODRAFT_253676 [Phytophthora sojae]